MTLDEQILELLRGFAPEITSLLKASEYFDLPKGIKKEQIAKHIGLIPGGNLYKQVLKAAKTKNTEISKLILNEDQERAFMQAAREVAKDLGIAFTAYDWQPLAQAYFQKHGGELIKSLNKSDINRLKEHIQYHFNENPKSFAKRYAESYSCAPSRLERIKRTETHLSGQAGGLSFAKEADAQYKTWHVTRKGKWPRPTHRAQAGMTVGIDEAFPVTGEQSPGEVNCRCYLTFSFYKKSSAK